MKDTEYKYFKALSDIFLNSINRKNTTITQTLSRFFYDAFRKERDVSKNEPVVYPNDYYELVYKTIEELASQSNTKNAAIEVRTVGSIWLLGEMSGTEISEQTYSWIWRNLLLAIRYKRDDMILHHWETADQYASFHLGYSRIDYESTNDEIKEKRKLQRIRFVEFHFALGGILLYQQRYNALSRIFIYTRSEPPSYELLPSSMDQIFSFYNLFRDPFDIRYPWISNQYPFPEVSGVRSDSIIKKWISSYMALLFLRQYTIHPYLITMKPLDFPNIPKTQGEIKQWIESIDFFRKQVVEHLANKPLLIATSLDFITIEWCKERNVSYPIEFIDKYKEILEQSYELNALNLEISKTKRDDFYKTTSNIIESTFQKYSTINNKEEIVGETNKWFVKGQRMLQSKDAYSEKSEIDYTNFQSALASSISRAFVEGIATTFQIKATKTFLLKDEDIFKGIDNLEINDQFCIVGFGIGIDYFIDQLKIPRLKKDSYKDHDLFLFDGSRINNQSFFILKKSNLPKISTRSINEDLITKFSLTKISESLNLYGSIIDLNKTTKVILDELILDNGKNEDDLRKSVLISIIISTEILWKKDVEIIQIQQYSEYEQRGLPNTITDIISLTKN